MLTGEPGVVDIEGHQLGEGPGPRPGLWQAAHEAAPALRAEPQALQRREGAGAAPGRGQRALQVVVLQVQVGQLLQAGQGGGQRRHALQAAPLQVPALRAGGGAACGVASGLPAWRGTCAATSRLCAAVPAAQRDIGGGGGSQRSSQAGHAAAGARDVRPGAQVGGAAGARGAGAPPRQPVAQLAVQAVAAGAWAGWMGECSSDGAAKRGAPTIGEGRWEGFGGGGSPAGPACNHPVPLTAGRRR